MHEKLRTGGGLFLALKFIFGSSRRDSVKTNLTSIHEDAGSIPGLSGLRIQCCRELWCRLVAIAPTGPLAWEPPYAVDVALKRQKKKKFIFELPSGQGKEQGASSLAYSMSVSN